MIFSEACSLPLGLYECGGFSLFFKGLDSLLVSGH
jgi:hypothetical protein